MTDLNNLPGNLCLSDITNVRVDGIWIEVVQQLMEPEVVGDWLVFCGLETGDESSRRYSYCVRITEISAVQYK